FSRDWSSDVCSSDLSEYLDFELNRGYDDDITLRHLLSHTAGFEERIHGLIAYGDEPVDLREVLATDPPEQVFRPGTTPSYSNYEIGRASCRERRSRT